MRQTYEAPALQKIGSVGDLTLGNNGTGGDGNAMASMSLST